MNRRAAALDRMSVLTIQKRTYARLQMRICWAFQRPTSTHFAAIGTALTTTNAAILRSTSRSEEHTSELQSLAYLVCRLLLEKKKKQAYAASTNNARYSQVIAPTDTRLAPT